MKRLLAVMVAALVFGVPLLVVFGWRLSAVLLAAWLGVLTIAVLVARAIDLVRERDELEIENRSMRQRLTVARTLVEGAWTGIPLHRTASETRWMHLADQWMRDEDADPHAVAMRERVAKLKAQREIDAIRS